MVNYVLDDCSIVLCATRFRGVEGNKQECSIWLCYLYTSIFKQCCEVTLQRCTNQTVAFAQLWGVLPSIQYMYMSHSRRYSIEVQGNYCTILVQGCEHTVSTSIVSQRKTQ